MTVRNSVRAAALTSLLVMSGILSAQAQTKTELGAGALSGYATILAFGAVCKFDVEKPIGAVLDKNIGAIITTLKVPDGTFEMMVKNSITQLSGHDAETCVWGTDKFNAMIAEMAKESITAATAAGIAQAPIPPSRRPLSSFPPDGAPATAAAAPAKGGAGALIDGTDVDAILAVAKTYGEATASKDSHGDPTLKLKSKGNGWAIYFYGCDKGASCSSIQFYYGLSTTTKPTPAQINEWNQTKRWARAYIDKDGDPNIVQDVNLSAGVARANLDASIARWTDTIVDFKAFLAKK